MNSEQQTSAPTVLQLVKMLFFSEDFRFRPRARRRPRRMAQLGLMRFRPPGIAQDRSARPVC